MASVRERLHTLGMDSDRLERAVGRMEALDALLEHWSAPLGLTSFGGGAERRERYFLEPLTAYPFVPLGGRMLDIGSGGGSPGLPLAIAVPESHWTLMESRRKKAWFLEEAVRELGLTNVVVEAARFGEANGRSWAGATCRGVRVEGRLVQKLGRALEPGGVFLWFSSRHRLAEVGKFFGPPMWERVKGPLSHRGDAQGGGLVVCRRTSA